MRHDAISAFTRWIAGLLLLAGAPTSTFAISAPPRSVAAPAASALTNWYVNAATGNDGFTCLSTGQPCQTITAAIAKASDGDTINIAAGVHIESGIVVDKALTVQGAGATQTIIDGAQADRVFRVQNPSTLRDLTVRNGRLNINSGAYLDNSGGGILAMSSVTLHSVIVTGNSVGGNGAGGGIVGLNALHIIDSQIVSNTSATLGGGIWKQGAPAMYITRTVFAGNIAQTSPGGAIYTSSPSFLTDATLSGNDSDNFGGALAGYAGIDLNRVTLSGNTANAGGAIAMFLGTITMTNVTVSGNRADNSYGGIYVTNEGITTTVRNSTIAGNTRASTSGNSADGLHSPGPVTVANSIFANNGSRSCNASGSPNWTSEGYNLSTDNSCGFFQTGDYSQVAALLAPLADNGGETQTHALLPGSYAIDGGNNASCAATDQRAIARPIDGDGVNGAACDIGAYESRQQVAVSDSSVFEGSGGTTTAVFTVTLVPTATSPTTVDYATSGGSASSGVDFTATTGTLTFNTGESVKTISVPVTPDTDDESDESFSLRLSNFAGDISDGDATGLIIDDDGLPGLSISDRSASEGNSGTRTAVFTVTLSPANATTVTVTYNTIDGSAVAPFDYTTAIGTLTFSPGQTSKTISVVVKGDVIDENASETFSVMLSNPVNAAITDGSALGTITDDDIALISMEFVQPFAEGNSGTTPVVVTLTLSTPAGFVVTTDYEFYSGSGTNGALENVDFIATSGTATFQPGETATTVTVQVVGERLQEEDELFNILLSNGTVAYAGTVASLTILNDDDGGGALVYLPYVAR